MVLVAVFEYAQFVQFLVGNVKSYLFLNFPYGRVHHIFTGTYMSGYRNIPKSWMGIFVYGPLLN